MAGSVPDSGGVYFVPAFGGLLAPWWQDDARGVIVGLTQYSTKVGAGGRSGLVVFIGRFCDPAEPGWFAVPPVAKQC